MRTCSAVLAVLVAVATSAAAREEVSPQCIGCICKALGCDLTRGCEGDTCGPYHISKGFFIDAEIPQEAGYEEETHQTCATDLWCSALAIRKYMARYRRDCDGNGKVTCADFALMHRLGAFGCDEYRTIERTDYWRKFQKCLGYYPDA